MSWWLCLLVGAPVDRRCGHSNDRRSSQGEAANLEEGREWGRQWVAGSSEAQGQ